MNMIPDLPPVLTIKNKHVLNAGLLLGLIAVAVQLIQHQFVSPTEVSPTAMALGGITFILSVVVLANGMKNYRNEELGGKMTFGRGFRFGFLSCIILGIVMMIFTYFFFKFINPGVIDEMLNKQMAELEKMGTSASDLENTMPYIEMFLKPGPISVLTFFTTLAYGLVYSLLAAAFTNNDSPKKSL